MVLPKNVFTTCPKANGKVMTVTNEYKILDHPSGRELMIVKDRRISLADIRKAAKCARMDVFNVRKIGATTNLESRDFPVASSVILVKMDNVSPVVPRMVTIPKFNIFKVVNGISTNVLVVENYITLSHIEKAAKCAGFKKYTAHPSAKTPSKLIVNEQSQLIRDVYLRNVIVPIVSTPPTRKYTITKASDGSSLMEVEGAITLIHLEKAAKCAGFKKYSVYVNQKKVAANSTTAIRNNVELRKAVVKGITHKPHVFNVCDQPSIIKNIKKSTKKVKMSKKQLLNTAIVALTELAKTL